MRFVRTSQIALFVLGAIIPSALLSSTASAADVPIDVSTAIGPRAIHIAGTVGGAQRLRAVLYATFSPDLPIVLLTQRTLTADGNGHFDATIPIAPAYFPGAVISVIVQSSSGSFIGQGSVTIPTPSFP
jgi:hypothetical protein